MVNGFNPNSANSDSPNIRFVSISLYTYLSVRSDTLIKLWVMSTADLRFSFLCLEYLFSNILQYFISDNIGYLSVFLTRFFVDNSNFIKKRISSVSKRLSHSFSFDWIMLSNTLLLFLSGIFNLVFVFNLFFLFFYFLKIFLGFLTFYYLHFVGNDWFNYFTRLLLIYCLI